MHTAFRSVRRFACAHDDVPAFHAVSIVLTLLAAALLNVGAFVVLIAAHAGLDLVKYRDVHNMGWGRTLFATFRESLLDLLFLAVALCFSLYLHHGQSVFALSGILRAEEILIRLFGIGLMRLEVLLHGMWVFSNVRQHALDIRAATGSWKRRETLWLCGLILATGFIVSAPFFMGPETVSDVLYEQLVPWRI